MMSERRAAAVMPASRPGSPVPVGGEREQAAFPYTAPFHILLVEDDSMTLMCVEKLLLRCGYSVTATSSPKLALSILASAACVPGARHVDLILTDVLMKPLSGYDLLKAVRDQDMVREMPPVVVMSAEEGLDKVLLAFECGAADYLIKPVRVNELATLWQHVWRANRHKASNSRLDGHKDCSQPAGPPQMEQQQQQRGGGHVKGSYGGSNNSHNNDRSSTDSGSRQAAVPSPGLAVDLQRHHHHHHHHHHQHQHQVQQQQQQHEQRDQQQEDDGGGSTETGQSRKDDSLVGQLIVGEDAKVLTARGLHSGDQAAAVEVDGPDSQGHSHGHHTHSQPRPKGYIPTHASSYRMPSGSLGGRQQQSEPGRSVDANMPGPESSQDQPSSSRPHSSLLRAQPTRLPVERSALHSSGTSCLSASLPLGLQELAAIGAARQGQVTPGRHEAGSSHAALQPVERTSSGGRVLNQSDRSAFTAFTASRPAAAMLQPVLRPTAEHHRPVVQIICSAFPTYQHHHHQLQQSLPCRPLEHSQAYGSPTSSTALKPCASAHRLAAVAKYLEKRKNRNFQKKVRYASRQRLAESRPRVRGQFVKLAEAKKEGEGSSGKRHCSADDSETLEGHASGSKRAHLDSREGAVGVEGSEDDTEGS